jgi:hypothetical protein
MNEKRSRGAPHKINLLGKTHAYKIQSISIEFAEESKKAIKHLMGTMTISDYLRARVIENGRAKSNGHPYEVALCNQKVFPFDKISWIEHPDNLRVHTLIQFPQSSWETFVYNCHIKGKSPKYVLCKYLWELCAIYHKALKYEKKNKILSPKKIQETLKIPKKV